MVILGLTALLFVSKAYRYIISVRVISVALLPTFSSASEALRCQIELIG